MPTFTIITAVFNAASTLTECINSVAAQSSDHEHILIDGGSTDGSLEIIKNAATAGLVRYVSEPDQGIYDAMNKGLRMATGKIVGLLNADDCYWSGSVLAHIERAFADPAVQSTYGDLVYVDVHEPSKITRHWKAGPFNHMAFYNGWMPPHPTFFVRREIYEQYGYFKLNLGTAADYELMLRFLLKHCISTHYIPHVLIRMRSGGASNASLKNRLAANRMDREAWRINELQPRPWTLLAKPVRKIGQFFGKGESASALPTSL